MVRGGGGGGREGGGEVSGREDREKRGSGGVSKLASVAGTK
jgi:hypothetical protein